ncbi:MAG: hypothetical protein JO126_00210 [Alphaproteobacteria bacterium]|nr:hypothetical protein [Alphaproteobacteria bacterium]MBV8547865.1 hypothetical protein [Alphaproteobacteria bacterium]
MSSQAAVEDGATIPQEQLRPLAAWVSKMMNVSMEALPTAIASGTRLKTSLGLSGVQQARSMAAYLPGQLLINNVVWDPESVRAQSYVLHELVHHAQLLSDRTYACHDAKEREAYTLQNQWLAEHGEEPAVTQEFIDKISSCNQREAMAD